MKPRPPIRSDEARAIVDLATASVEPGVMVKAKRLHRRRGVTDLDVQPGQLVGTLDDDAGADTTTITIDSASWVPDSLPALDQLVHTCEADGEESCEHIAATLLELASLVEENQRLLARFTTDPDGSAETTEDLGNDRPTSIPHLETLLVPIDIEIGDEEDVDIAAVIAEARRVITSSVSRFRPG